MSFIKKLVISSILILILLSLSYVSYDIGEVSFKSFSTKVSMPANFVLAVLVIIWFAVNTLSSLLKWMFSIFKKNEIKTEKNSQNSLINLLFVKSISDINKYDVCDKYQNIKEAIECSLFYKLNKLPETLFETNKSKKTNIVLTIHKIKLNLCKYINDNNIETAAKLTEEVINKYPSYVNFIKEEMLYIATHIRLKFNPRKYKYNLSRKYINEYEATLAIREFNTTKNVAVLEKKLKKSPFNSKIAIEFIKNVSNISEKRIISVIKNCFSENPDRHLAESLFYLKKRENLFEMAMQITANVSNNDLEKLWFLCIIATKTGHISKASEILQTIMKNYSGELQKIIEFFVLNHAKFSKNIELIQLIKEFIKNEDRNN